MKIDIVHFMVADLRAIIKANEVVRSMGKPSHWITGDSINEATPYSIFEHPIRIGVNATITRFPLGIGNEICASYHEADISRGSCPTVIGYHWDAHWTLATDGLPPAEVITTRDANYQEEALLRMSKDYWKDFTRQKPQFAARVAPAFLEEPKSFDEIFKKVSVPMAKNFQRDMAIILLWKEWKADWNMSYQKAVADLAVRGFQVDVDAFRKIRDKYALPSFKD